MPPQVFMNYIHPSSMLKQLACLWNQGQLCDAVITVDNCIVAKAHRLVLFAASPKLKAQAESSSDGINSAVLQVKLPSMLSQRSIDLFLHYLYEGYLMLTEGVIHDMLKIADHLDLKCLYKCCLEYCRQNQLDIQSKSPSSSQVEDYGHVRLMNVDLQAEDLEPKNSKIVSSAVTSKDDSKITKSTAIVQRASHSESSEKASKTHDSSHQEFTKHKQTPQKSHTQQTEVINLDSDDDDFIDDDGGGGNDFSNSSQSNISCNKTQSSLSKPPSSQFGNRIEQDSSAFQENSREKRLPPKTEMARSSCSEKVSSNYSTASSQSTSGVYIKTEPNMSPSCSLNTSASQSSFNTDYVVTMNTSNYPIETEVDIKPILENLEQYEENSAVSNEQMLSNQMASTYYSETSSHSMASADQHHVYMEQDSESYGADFSAMQSFEDQSGGATNDTICSANQNYIYIKYISPNIQPSTSMELQKEGPLDFNCTPGNKTSAVCSVCGKSCSTKRNLRKHMCIHSNERKFRCTVCDASFKRRDYLSAHMSRHSDARPHVCETCGATFKRKVSINKHKRHVHCNKK